MYSQLGNYKCHYLYLCVLSMVQTKQKMIFLISPANNTILHFTHFKVFVPTYVMAGDIQRLIFLIRGLSAVRIHILSLSSLPGIRIRKRWPKVWTEKGRRTDSALRHHLISREADTLISIPSLMSELFLNVEGEESHYLWPSPNPAVAWSSFPGDPTTCDSQWTSIRQGSGTFAFIN